MKDSSFEKAIDILGGRSFAYGLESDLKIKPELDLSVYAKKEAYLLMKKNKIIVEN